MAERQTQSPPMMDQLRATILNALTSPIPQGMQKELIQQPGIGVRDLGIVAPAINRVPNNPVSGIQGILQQAQGSTSGISDMIGGAAQRALGMQEQPTPMLQPSAQPSAQPHSQQTNIPPDVMSSVVEKQGGGFGGSGLSQLLLRLGVPLGAAIAGSVSPGMLSSAAGLSSGFVKGLSEADKLAAARQKETSPKEAANIRKQRLAIKSARNVVGVLKKTLEKIKPHSGTTARIVGAGRTISGGAGLDPDVSTYNNIRKSVLGQMAKIVSGESGRLTDQDIARIEAAIPRVTDTKEEREIAFGLLEQILGEAERTFGVDSGERIGMTDPVQSSQGKTSSGVGYTIRSK